MPRTWDEIVNILRERENKQIEREHYALQLYVSAQGSISFSNKECLQAEQVVTDFISSEVKQMLLLLGDAGAGKSLLCHRLALNAWQQGERIPLLIPLVVIDNPEKDLIDKHLRKRGLAAEEILLLKQRGQFLFILDGYDELNSQANLYQTNRLQEWQAKVIISCRSQAFMHQDYQGRFIPNRQPQALQELVLQPFNEAAMQHYLAKAAAQTQDLQTFTVDTYWSYLAQLPAVKKLISNPFLLSLVVVALPRLVVKHGWQLDNTQTYRHQQLTRSDLYDAFVEHWCERQIEKLEEQGKLTLTDGHTLAADDFITFNRLIATTMLERGENKLTYQPQAKTQLFSSGHSQAHDWQSVFFSQEEKVLRLRSAWLLKKVDDKTYTFLHKSLLEYFAARHLFDGIVAHTAFAFGRSLNAKLLVHEPSVLAFLADKVKQDKRLAPLLWELIEASKHDPLVAIGAANAISILNAASYSFAAKDLRGIRIFGADLSGAILDGADCREADFRNVQLMKASLNYVDFSGACLEGVQLGQQAPLMFEAIVEKLVYSPDGQWLAIGDQRGYIYLYDQKKTLVHTLKNWALGQCSNNIILALAFSPDSQILAVGSKDGYVRLWQVKTGKQLKKWQGGGVTLSFMSDGKLLASINDDKTIKLWNVNSGRCIKTLQKHTNQVTTFSFMSDDRLLAASWDGKTIKLWDMSSGQCIQTLQGHKQLVMTASFAPDGKLLASSSLDKTIKLWDVSSGQCIQTIQAHIDSIMISFAADGKQLAASSLDRTIKLWDVNTGQCTQILQGHTDYITTISFAPNGAQLASGSLDKTVKLWDVADSRRFETLHGCINEVTRVNFMLDGKLLAVSKEGKTIKLWDMRSSGQCIQTLQGHMNKVLTVSFSPDGKQLASGSEDYKIKLWDVNTGQCIQTLREHTNYVTAVNFAPDGKLLASSSFDKTIKLWDVSSGQCIKTLEASTQLIITVIFAPDGKQLVSSDYTNIKLWDVNSGQCIKTLQGHTDWVSTISFAPDGKQLASGGYDKLIKLWDVNSGQGIKTLKGHIDTVTTISFSADGKQLVSGSTDSTIRLWEVSSGHCLMVRQLPFAIDSLDWRSNYLLTVEEPGRVSRWQIDGQRLLLHSSNQPPVLSVNQLILSQATGLSLENLRLLQQYGAKGQVSKQSSQEAIAARNKAERVGLTCDSVFGHLPTGEAFTLTSQHWVVSIARKKLGQGKEHAILFLEGIDAQGYLQLRQIEFFLDTDKPHPSVKLPLVGMLAIGQGLIQCKPKTRYDAKALLEQCVIRSEAISLSQAEDLLKQVMTDSQQPINYNQLGDNVLFIALSPYYNYDNCLTRAEKWLESIGVQFVQERDWRSKLAPVAITSRRNYFQVSDEYDAKTSTNCLVM